MKRRAHFLRIINLIFGFISILFFVFDAFVFARLRPKMVAFQSLTAIEEPLLTWVGFGLIVIMAYFLLSSLQLVRYIRRAEKIGMLEIILLVSGVISFVAVFADLALLSDIHKQYLHTLSQPEWFLVYPMMSFQFLIGMIYFYFHISGRWALGEMKAIVRDMNVFLTVQIVGVVSGLMGLGLMSLGFFFASGWNFTVHTLISSVILLFPYTLSVFYWAIMKIRQKERVWFDEKQQQDLGKSALLTLAIVTLGMIFLFIINLSALNGVIQFNWLPFYLFSVIVVFSSGNLYFSNRA